MHNDVAFKSENITAIIVLYHPNKDKLNALLASLRKSVMSFILIDNTPSQSASPVLVDDILAKRTTIIPLGENRGIAEAQNIGIAKALENNADFLLFMDQDSEALPGMVETLLSSFKILSKSEQVAAVGPAQISGFDSTPLPFTQIAVRRSCRKIIPRDERPVRLNHVISSGMLTTSNNIKRIGGMAADFFIDYVDIEWCFRAISMGYAIYGIPNARLIHRLGNEQCRYFFGLVTYNPHRPERYYYIVRNNIKLIQKDYLGLGMKLLMILRLLPSITGYVLLGDINDFFQRLRCVAYGFIDGIRDRGGVIPFVGS